MSLVSEALKKAEREAVAREAREKGLPSPLETPLQPYRARRRRRDSFGAPYLLPILAILGTAAAVVIAVLLARPEAERKASVKGATVEASGPASVPASDVTSAPGTALAEPAPTTFASAARAPSATTVPMRSAPSASESNAGQEPRVPLPKTAAKPPPTSPSVSEPQTPKLPAVPAPLAPTAPTPPAGRVSGDYLRRVDLPDGTRLELGGIVYSEAAPFAYLNGRLVGVGEFVEGFRIDRIERERVLLSGDAGALTIRLKGP